jgi:hypothetical protein
MQSMSELILMFLFGMIGVALEVARVILLVFPGQRTQDILRHSILPAKIAVRSVLGLVKLEAGRADHLPAYLFMGSGSRFCFGHHVPLSGHRMRKDWIYFIPDFSTYFKLFQVEQ